MTRLLPALLVGGLLLALLGVNAPASAQPAASPGQLLCAGRLDDAIEALKARTREVPNDAEAFQRLARAYYSSQRWDEAVAAAERAVALRPNSSDDHLWLGRAYGEKADHSSFFSAARLAGKARTEFERAVELNAASAQARRDLAEFYLEAPGVMGGGKDKALAQAQALAATDPAAAHWVKGRLAEKEKKFDLAEKEYLAAVQESNSKAGRWLDLAAFYRSVARFEDMEQAINKGVSAEPRAGSELFDAANLLYMTGRNLTAAAQFVRTYLASACKVEEAPAFQAHYLLGSILEKQGDKTAAAAEYRAALSLARDFRDAQAALKRVTP